MTLPPSKQVAKASRVAEHRIYVSHAPTIPWYLSNRASSGDNDAYTDCIRALLASTANEAEASNAMEEEISALASLRIIGCDDAANPNTSNSNVQTRLAPTDPEYPFVVSTTRLMVSMTRFRPTSLARSGHRADHRGTERDTTVHLMCYSVPHSPRLTQM